MIVGPQRDSGLRCGLSTNTMSNLKFTELKKQKYLGLLRKGLRRGKAAEAVGTNRDHIYQYVKKHPDFRNLVEQAEADACEDVEDALYKKCVEDRHFPSIVFWLLNRSQGRWQDRRSPSISIQPVFTQQDQAALLQPENLNDELAKFNALFTAAATGPSVHSEEVPDNAAPSVTTEVRP